jgi:hypothetical protein
LQERFDQRSAGGFAGLFFVADVAAEFDAGAALGFGAGHTRALEIIGAVLDV